MYTYIFIPSAVLDIEIKLPFSSGPIFPSVAPSVALDPPSLLQEKVPGLDAGDSVAVQRAPCTAVLPEIGRSSRGDSVADLGKERW